MGLCIFIVMTCLFTRGGETYWLRLRRTAPLNIGCPVLTRLSLWIYSACHHHDGQPRTKPKRIRKPEKSTGVKKLPVCTTNWCVDTNSAILAQTDLNGLVVPTWGLSIDLIRRDGLRCGHCESDAYSLRLNSCLSPYLGQLFVRLAICLAVPFHRTH